MLWVREHKNHSTNESTIPIRQNSSPIHQRASWILSSCPVSVYTMEIRHRDKKNTNRDRNEHVGRISPAEENGNIGGFTHRAGVRCAVVLGGAKLIFEPIPF